MPLTLFQSCGSPSVLLRTHPYLLPSDATHEGHLPIPTEVSAARRLRVAALHDQCRRTAESLSQVLVAVTPGGGCPLRQMSLCHRAVASLCNTTKLHRRRPSCAERRVLYDRTAHMALSPFVRTASVIRRNHNGDRPKGPNRSMYTSCANVVHRTPLRRSAQTRPAVTMTACGRRSPWSQPSEPPAKRCSSRRALPRRPGWSSASSRSWSLPPTPSQCWSTARRSICCLRWVRAGCAKARS